MPKFFDSLTPEHAAFIAEQKMFFTGSSAPGRETNISPKGMFGLKITGPNGAAFISAAGSGNRTAEDVAEGAPLTIMFCGFGKRPLILRLYCRAEAVKPSDPRFDSLLKHWEGFSRGKIRDVFLLDIYRVQESCGWGVPYYTYDGERTESEKLRLGALGRILEKVKGKEANG